MPIRAALLGQLLRVAGAVEEAEVEVAVRRTEGGELNLFTLPDAVTARLDSPVSFANSRPDQAVAGLRTGVTVDCAVGPQDLK
jgi:hypothetical protein